MSRFKRNMIIGGAVLLVMAAALAALMLWPDNQPADDDDDDYSYIEDVELVNLTVNEVKSITFSRSGGRAYTVTVDGDMLYIRDPLDNFTVDQNSASNLVSTALSQRFLDLVIKEPTNEQLASFGLDRPAMTWVVKRTDSTEATYCIGGKTPTGEGYYAMQSGKKVVCVISEYSARALMISESELYDISFAPVYVEDSETGETPTLNKMAEYVKLTSPDGSVVEIVRKTEEEMESSLAGDSTYKMLRPVESDTNDFYLESLLFDKIGTITPEYEIGNAVLEDPYSLKITDVLGWERSLLIGGTDPESGGRLIQYEGTNTVFVDTAGDYSFLDTDISYLRQGLVWIYPIETVDSLEVSLDGVKRVIDINVNSDGDGDASMDGRELDLTNAKRIYTKTLGIMIDGSIDPGTEWGKLRHEMTIRLNSGETHVLRLYELNSRRFGMELDGKKMDFYTLVTTVQPLIDSFDYVARGEEIPR